MKQIILLSDTHNKLDERFFPHFNKADEIWHAGDIGNISVTEKLKEFASIKAVWGNIDNIKIRNEFTKNLYFQCEQINIMMTHIGGYPGKYNKDLISVIKSKKIDLLISGHSHILKVMYDQKYNFLYMNPGAIGDYGIHKVKTILCFNIDGDKIKNLRVVEFDRKTT